MQAADWTPGARRTRHPPQHGLTAIIDSQFGLREHPGMTDSKDDTAVLTTALNHSWAWYDEHMKRVLQVINFYIVATALLVTAYASAINGKHYGYAVALAIVGLVLTAIASASGLSQMIAAGKADKPLRDMQGRIAGRLDADSIRMVERQDGIKQTRRAAILTVVLPTALFVIALIKRQPAEAPGAIRRGAA